MDFDEIKELVDDFRQECSFENREEREQDMDMRCSSPEGIFRELPDSNYTPIEFSNDTIALSPAWSQDSLLDIMEEDDHKPSATNAATSSSHMYLSAGASPSNSVTRISDFDMNSGTIQRLNF